MNEIVKKFEISDIFNDRLKYCRFILDKIIISKILFNNTVFSNEHRNNVMRGLATS